MALLPALRFASSGNFSEAFGSLFVSQEEFDRGAAADSALERLNNQAYEQGRISSEENLRRLQNINANRLDTGAIFQQEGTNVAAGFVAGWKEGADRIQSGIKNTVGGVLNWGLGSIPWQVWVGLLIYGAWQLGLFALLKRRIAKT
jgi:hypothetical protein